MTKLLMWVLWPSFLLAAVAVGFVFSALDPNELNWFGQSGELSSKAVYTLGFFFFWLLGAGCGAATLLLSGAYKERA